MKRLLAMFFVLVALGVGLIVAQRSSPAVPSAGTAKRVIQPANYKPTPSPLSPAILVGDTLYMSGATGGDPASGQLVQGGFEPEMRQIMSNLQTVLKAANMDLTDVVAVTAYLGDMSNYTRFNEIYREYFKVEPLPTRSTVAVKELARGAAIELTMTAVRTAK
jgi:reactive intermediate/imine deaminase